MLRSVGGSGAAHPAAPAHAVRATTSAEPEALAPAALRRVVAVLSVSVITSYGVLYYAFPVLLTEMAADTGWSAPLLTAAFSAGQIACALLGIFVGRILDRSGPRRVMTAGSLATVPAVLIIALAPNYPVFFAGWLLAGAAMAGLLYAPAFAALTHWGGIRRVGALTTLTLVAGLASTIFAPLTAALNTRLDWRATYLVLLAVFVIVTVPAHWFGLRYRWVAHEPRSLTPTDSAPAPIVSSRAFVLLAVSFSAVAFAIWAGLINLVPLLIERGLTPGQAALALGLGGVGQVLGRLGYASFAARTGLITRTVLVIGFVAATTALLAGLPGPIPVLIGLSVLLGVARGLFTLIQATAVSDRWGAGGYGRLNGILSAPVLIAGAIAPFAGALIAHHTGGQAGAWWVLAGFAALATLIAAGTRPRTKEPQP